MLILECVRKHIFGAIQLIFAHSNVKCISPEETGWQNRVRIDAIRDRAQAFIYVGFLQEEFRVLPASWVEWVFLRRYYGHSIQGKTDYVTQVLTDICIYFVDSHPLKIGSSPDKVLVLSESAFHFVEILETFEGSFDFIGFRIEGDSEVNYFHVSIQAAKTSVRQTRRLNPHEYLISFLLT